MRVFIVIALGALVVAVVVYAFRQLWYAAFPTTDLLVVDEEQMAADKASWLETRSARIAVALIALLFLGLSAHHLFKTRERPSEVYRPAHLENGRIIPGSFYHEQE